MDTTIRKQGPRLDKLLYKEPYNFEFAQAVKLLELLDRDCMTLGSGAYASHEAVRIKSNIKMSLPPSDLYKLESNDTDHLKPTLTINFIGIAGQTGPLPNVFSEVILNRTRHGDTAFRDFLDIFNHRIASIHYRITVKHTLTLSHKQPEHSVAGRVLTAFAGLEHKDKNKEAMPRRCFLKYAGLLWQKPTSAISLQVFLRDLFALDLKVEQFVGKWYAITPQIRTKIGPQRSSTGPIGQMNRLGIDAALGKRAWILKESVRVVFQNLSLENYRAMLPGQKLNTFISDATRHFLGREHDFDFQLELHPGEEVTIKLDGTATLGWTSWLGGATRTMIPEPIIVSATDPEKLASQLTNLTPTS